MKTPSNDSDGQEQRRRGAVRGGALLALALLATACAQKTSEKLPAHIGMGGYEQVFDPVRGSSRALGAAEQGDREALTAFFLCGYVALNERAVTNDERAQIRLNYGELLKCMTDESFASALARERPEVQSAAKEFLDLAAVKSYYLRTAHLLDAVPSLDWPAK
jgi:hypothetical protein